MHLESDIFDLVKYGIKDIEIRLNDEKRRNIKIGDIITIINRVTLEKINVKVISLEYFDTFYDCVSNYEIKRLYNDKMTKEEFIKLLYQFYSKEDEINNGVVAIGLKVI